MGSRKNNAPQIEDSWTMVGYCCNKLKPPHSAPAMMQSNGMLAGQLSIAKKLADSPRFPPLLKYLKHWNIQILRTSK
jgi:hypothetical protein